MRNFPGAAAAVVVAFCTLIGATHVQAAEDVAIATPAAPPRIGAAPDPALRNALTGFATLLLADVAGRLAGGSGDDFDPGPALQRAMNKLLESDAADRLINGALAQSTGGDAASGLPPELRAALAVAVRAAVAGVRREISRETANP